MKCGSSLLCPARYQFFYSRECAKKRHVRLWSPTICGASPAAAAPIPPSPPCPSIRCRRSMTTLFVRWQCRLAAVEWQTDCTVLTTTLTKELMTAYYLMRKMLMWLFKSRRHLDASHCVSFHLWRELSTAGLGSLTCTAMHNFFVMHFSVQQKFVEDFNKTSRIQHMWDDCLITQWRPFPTGNPAQHGVRD